MKKHRNETGVRDRTGKMISAGDVVVYYDQKMVVQIGYHPDTKKNEWLVVNPGSNETFTLTKTGKKKYTGRFMGGFSRLGPNCYGLLPKIVGRI